MTLERGIESTELDRGRLVGRRRELGVAAAALSAAGPAALVIEGPAGIGKTTVLRHMLDTAGAGTSTLWCRTAEAEAAMPYVGVADLADGAADDDLAALDPSQRAALETVRLRSDTDTGLPAVRIVAGALLALFDVVGARGPLIIGIDDAQWLDPPSEATLRFVLRRLRDRNVLPVITVRSDGGSANPVGIHDAFPDSVRQLALGPLSHGAIHDLIHERLGVRLPRPALLRVSDVSGGNPFYALELARALIARDSLDDPAAVTSLTDRLHRIVDHRILGLSPRARDLATLAAAATKPTVATLVEASAGSDWAGSGGAEAEDAGLLEVDGGAVRFTHSLLAAGVLDNAAPSEVRAAHSRLAAVTRDSESRARHLAAAAPGADAAVATAVARAAEAAWKRGARIAAAELSDRAVAVTPESDRVAVDTRRLRAAAFAFEAGNPERARTHLAEVVDSPDESQRVAALVQLGSVRFHVRGFDATADALDHAWRSVAPDDHRTRAKIKIEMTFAGVVGDDRSDLRSHAETAMQEARLAGDPDLVHGAAGVGALARFATGDGVDQGLIDIALEGYDSDQPLAVNARLPAGAVLLWTDRLDEARAVFTDELDRSSARGDFIEAPLLTWLLTDTELRAGNLEEALRLAEETVDGTRIRAGDLEVALAFASRARALGMAGSLGKARDDAATALGIAAGVGGIALGYSVGSALLVEATAGAHDAVHAVGGPALAVARNRGTTDPAFLRWVPDEIEALISLGDLAAAKDALDWFSDLCTRTGRVSARAAERRCRALLDAELGDEAGALASADEAVDLISSLPLPFEEGRALLAAGRIHRRGRRKRLAHEMFRRARDRFDGMGAVPWARRAEEELARSGLGGTGDSGVLTEGELRVAHTVAAGATNKDAAAALFMSAKTIEHHLTRIYAKLGIRSRHDLAAALEAIDDPARR